MKAIGFYYNDRFLTHDTGSTHPERPQRLEAITRAVAAARVDGALERVTEFPARAPESLHLVHSPEYVGRVRQEIAGGATLLDAGDTVVGAQSYDAALLAADAAVDAATRVWHGELPRAFVAPRPPGHHAEASAAMGFCLFNNIAVAARWLLQEGASRVAIVDWDVHHGNGTQHAFYAEPRVLFISLHEYPHYPGTGSASERGTGEGEGTTINIPMRAGSGDDAYRTAFNEIIVPALDDFAPELILISAGFDAHQDDPLSSIRLSTEAYGEMTRTLCAAADRLCGGKVVSLLEGGYDLDALATSVVRHLEVLAGLDPVADGS